MKLFCVLLCVIAGTLAAHEDFDPFNEYWNAEYYDTNDKGIETSSTEVVKDDINKAEAEIKAQDGTDLKEPDNNSVEESIADDYQVEDNRSGEKDNNESQPKDDIQSDLNNNEESVADDGDIGELPFEGDEPQSNDSFEEFEEEQDDGIEQNFNDNLEENDEEANGDDDFWGDSQEAPLPVPNKEDSKIFEETKQILENDADNEFNDQPEEENNVEKKENDAEETNKENDDADLFDADQDTDELLEKIDDKLDSLFTEAKEDNKSNESEQEDTVDKVYSDLNADLDKLFETIEKLKEGETDDENENEEEIDVQDYEDKFTRPYKEGAILSARGEDYDVIGDSNLTDIFNDHADDDTAAEETNSNENNKVEDAVQNVDKEYKNDDTELFADNSQEDKQAGKQDLDDGSEYMDELNDEESNINDNSQEDKQGEKQKSDLDDGSEYMDELNDEESNPEDNIDEAIKAIFGDNIAPYGDDGLVAEGQPKESEAEEFEPVNDTNETVTDKKAEISNETPKSKMVDELNSAELEDLMEQFVVAHKEDLDVNSEDFDKKVAPVHITLSVDEPVVVTSPNYPDPYPTNNIIDWVFEGEGRGIELNITDFAVNGALGDYFLIKPGSTDASGDDGLIFSYRLNSERRYRFTDVNRMFVRFEAKMGMMFMRGFRFSVRSILPALERLEETPEAEPIVHPPQHTLTVNLAGLTVTQFHAIQESFQELIADMAAQYINENEIYYGINSTLEVAQITRSAVCSIHLPNYETCVEVTFGVPLNYGDEDIEPRLNGEDLEDMWNTLIQDEVFAERLRQMGVKEYILPNDRTVLTVWLVVAAGVLISMAMLGFALWRFSCFEDYTRMRSFSDGDSITIEKRNLDLYPTPHQTLPPLYAESEYKWGGDTFDDSTRVDMGGFANKSYARDDMYDFESDEDVVAPKDRKADISSRDIYAV